MIIRLCVFYNTLKNMAYYAVAKGRNTGIYSTWDECKMQVHQYSGPIYKKFSSFAEAESFIQEKSGPNISNKSRDTKPVTGKRPRAQADNSTRRKAIILENNDERLFVKKYKSASSTNSSSSVCTEENKSSKDFTIDNDGYVSVFTDGACSSNGRKNARAGIGVWFGDSHPQNVSQPVVGRATNNMAEIQAVTVAARQAKKMGIKKLKINTDSKFLISCINDWMPKWKRNGWQTLANKPVINKDELIEMEEALNSLQVKWNHVNGHVGIHGNEMADKLARAGCSGY